MAPYTPQNVLEVKDQLEEDRSPASKALSAGAGLAHVGAGAALGKYLGKKQLSSHKITQYFDHLRDVTKNSPRDRKMVDAMIDVVKNAPMVGGAAVGAVPGIAASKAIRNEDYKEKGVDVSPTGSIRNITPEAQEKYAAQEESRFNSNAGMYGAALGAAAGLGYGAYKSRGRSLDNMASQAESAGFKFKTYEDIKDAAETIGLKFKDGDFYKPSGEKVKKKKDVKKAYKRTAMKNHPDRNPDDPDATERFKKINEAFNDTIKGDDNFEKLAAEDLEPWRAALLGMMGGAITDAGQAVVRGKGVSGFGAPIGGALGYGYGKYRNREKS